MSTFRCYRVSRKGHHYGVDTLWHVTLRKFAGATSYLLAINPRHIATLCFVRGQFQSSAYISRVLACLQGWHLRAFPRGLHSHPGLSRPSHLLAVCFAYLPSRHLPLIRAASTWATPKTMVSIICPSAMP